MALKKASAKKSYKVDELDLLRILSSGIRLSKATVKAMGIEAGDKVQYAEDEDSGDIYIFAATETEGGSTLGKNLTFVNAGLEAKLKTIAEVPTLEVKGGKSVWFTVAQDAIEEEGTLFFKLSFDKVDLGDDAETASNEVEEVEEDPFS